MKSIRRLRSAHNRRSLLAAWALATTVVAAGCAGRIAAPPQLSTAGAIAFHVDRVIRGIAALQQVAIDGEAQKVFSTMEARAIVQATEIAAKTGVELAQALRAGLAAQDAKEKALATIRQALMSVPKQLSPAARQTIEPYVTIVLVSLMLLE